MTVRQSVQVTSTTWRSPELLERVASSVRESKVCESMVKVPADGRARLPARSMVAVAVCPTLKVLELKTDAKKLVEVAWVEVLRVMESKM